MAVWPTLQTGGTAHDLSHLEPFAFVVDSYTLLVEFSCHCFTRTLEPHETAAASLGHIFEHRGFDPLRYGLSVNLPKIIRDLPNNYISPSRENNLIFVELADGFFYHVIFRIERIHTRRISILVRSAYPAAQRRHQKGRMKFLRAIALIAQGKPLRFP